MIQNLNNRDQDNRKQNSSSDLPRDLEKKVSCQFIFDSPYEEQTYKDILKVLKIRKLTLDEKVDRLGDILKNGRYDEFLNKIMGNNDQLNNQEELLQKQKETVYQYTKFHGSPFLLKSRKLDLERYYYDTASNSFIPHFGIFFEKGHTMYHFIPLGVKSGESEYNKEATNDWKLSDDNKNGAFFTLIKPNEIEYFVKKWNENARLKKYSYRYKTSKIFAYTLLYWLI